MPRRVRGRVAGRGCLRFRTGTILAFLRISITRVPGRQPLSAPEAVVAVDEWLTLPNVILRPMPSDSQCRGPLAADAALAALATAHALRSAPTTAIYIAFPACGFSIR